MDMLEASASLVYAGRSQGSRGSRWAGHREAAITHTGLAPALVLTAGFDPPRGEGNEYAAALLSAGVTVDHRQFDSLTHGYAGITQFGGGSADATTATISAIRAHLSRG